ncbi:MAG: transcription termination/antitermination protein NusG [Oscillospiraceae bacterium]
MEQENDGIARWYVVHTYSGYENKVSQNLETIVENRRLQDLICEVKVPVEIVPDIKDGKEREIERKLFPGYVLVKMVMTDESWYIVRNTRGVTGFVGSTTKPIPLSDEEVDKLGVDVRTAQLDYAVGDNVQVIDGPLEGFIGIVEEIDTAAQKVKVKVSMFGRETPAELSLTQVKPL